MFIVSLIVIGLIAGLVARLLVPGRDPIGIVGTIILGIVGSFVGGFLFDLISGGDADGLEPAGILGSIVGAVIVLLLYNAVSQRGAVGGRRRSRLLR